VTSSWSLILQVEGSLCGQMLHFMKQMSQTIQCLLSDLYMVDQQAGDDSTPKNVAVATDLQNRTLIIINIKDWTL